MVSANVPTPKLTASDIRTTPPAERDRDPIAPAVAEHAQLERLVQVLRPNEAEVELITADGEALDLPSSLLRALRRSTEILAGDDAVVLERLSQHLTAHEAAELLDLPIPHVVKLLDNGDLPVAIVDNDRTVPLADVLAYRDTLDVRRHHALDEMARLSQGFGLYDLDYSTIKLKRLAEFEEEVSEPQMPMPPIAYGERSTAWDARSSRRTGNSGTRV